MKSTWTGLAALTLTALCIYLFVSAPPPLPEEGEAGASASDGVPIEVVLEIIAAENDVARSLYTKEIVGRGKAAGISFSEFWRQADVQAGPLPALFLREAAASVQDSPVPLGLFLGSDFPISPSNRFEGKQAQVFEEIKRTREPVFFYAEDTLLHTMMFPDFSSVAACVSCHNEHPESPKTDWQLDDVMGATTWSYPRERVSRTELLEILGAVRAGFSAAYAAFLAEVEGWDEKPPIGEAWPRDGYALPSLEVFLAEFSRRASSQTVAALLRLDNERKER